MASGEHDCVDLRGQRPVRAPGTGVSISGRKRCGSRAPDHYYPMESENPLIIRDFSKCVLCGRCVQACNEVQVNNAISFGYRGAESKIVAAGDYPLENSDCVFCGECVQVCPVGALVEKKAKGMGRPWETTQVRTTCTYCGVGCQLHLHIKDGRIIKVTGVEDAAPNQRQPVRERSVRLRIRPFPGSPDRAPDPQGQRFFRSVLGRSLGPGRKAIQGN